jgi:hypothetical protein
VKEVKVNAKSKAKAKAKVKVRDIIGFNSGKRSTWLIQKYAG